MADLAENGPLLTPTPSPPSESAREALQTGAERVVALEPSLDPWECFQRLSGLRGLLFLESADFHPARGRYSFLTADPFAWLTARGREVWWRANGAETLHWNANPLEVLARKLKQYASASLPGLPPFQGGVAGLFGYDLCHHIERLPRPRCDEFQVPELAVGFYDWVLSFDHLEERSWLIVTGWPEREMQRRRVQAGRRLDQVRRWLDAGTAPGKQPRVHTERLSLADLAPQARPFSGREVTSTFSRDEYLHAVRRAVEYVHAGDCFQVNLSQRLLTPARLAPLELYARLRQRNPAPFAGYFDLGEFVLASSSPERFLAVQEGEIETRPIKGTRRRDPHPETDRARAEELLHSAKDRAENVMIVDLLRNDLGRVCDYGSIRVPTVCGLESYRYVHHLVSEVRGQLRRGLGLGDLLRAAFPGGSVTGAPKVRAMEIIAELEPTSRGPYCGSLGYLGFNGAMDTNLLIRTCTLGRGWVQFPVGGGIVADSDPEEEYAETLHKAEGMLRALE